ncbi:MAG: hypothetical protein M1833_000781 [Piccolia ochrophora]|nr:MAG: hypothetical protein M1833_000781 [Piccolia ochrophora]
MNPLNPFLRAFFRSTLPAQCNPVNNHILLVPTTEILLVARDRETNTSYADLASSEEFLGSHVLRVPGSNLSAPGKETASTRDLKGKAKQFNTVNGRTVVIKDGFVYSNKGFKDLSQAQLLNDSVYYPNVVDFQQWLIYYISHPLLGALEITDMGAGLLPRLMANGMSQSGPMPPATLSAKGPRKKELKSFSDLLSDFPMIARQMHGGLDQVFKDFSDTLQKPLPPTPEDSADGLDGTSASSVQEGPSTEKKSRSNGHISAPRVQGLSFEDMEGMRHALETAVIATIDLFQLVDKQQLSLLGATTDLTGPLVERLIERYVAESVHHTTVFPRICALKRPEDQELESRIRQMDCVDISQVGIAISGGKQAQHEMVRRLGRGVEEFQKLGVAGSPQEMLEILLNTEKSVTMANEGRSDIGREVTSSVLTFNADTLVSLLLIVVIRSQVRHLHARLFYMRQFIFMDDVEAGESGYALSTFEAVLSYLARDSAGLRKASRRNKLLWQATKDGDVEEMKQIFQPEDAIDDDATEALESHSRAERSSSRENFDDFNRTPPSPRESLSLAHRFSSSTLVQSTDGASGLAHVFPFQTTQDSSASDEEPAYVRRKKRVSMDTRSMSSSSAYSFLSRTTTIDSKGSGIEGDTSVERLSKTHDPSGDSVLMMAVEHSQHLALKYLLSLQAYYPLEIVLDDSKNDGTTLLSAAVQVGHTETINSLLDRIYPADHEQAMRQYLQRPDARGRTAAHYLFNAPKLVEKLGRLLPWKMRDKNGQTPLFALCRSYDHPDYHDMVRRALATATASQGDGAPLHLDDHVDSKGNTLLHIIHDPQLTSHILTHCDSDANATNDKKFTPLMVASKYGRVDMVKALFADAQVDTSARELRGLTAVELAKDDDVRNRIDDLILFSNQPDVNGRTTAVVRSFFVDDASVRLVLKSAVPASSTTITITTCRRSVSDFENLAQCLSTEHPASWLPALTPYRSPFQILSRPSRAVLRDIQLRFDHFLKTLLAHSTFSNHEMLWEFFLVPEMPPEMMLERSQRKAQARAEKVEEEYPPVDDVADVEIFIGHARGTVDKVHRTTRRVVARSNRLKLADADLYDAHSLMVRSLSLLSFLDAAHETALRRLTTTLAHSEASALTLFHSDLLALLSTVTAMLAALSRPQSLIASMATMSKAIERHQSSLRRSDRWPLGLLDDTRARLHQDAADKMATSQRELVGLGSELSYSQQTVAAELAAWQDLQVSMGRNALKNFAKRTVVAERARLEAMKRAMRGVVAVD